MKLRPRRNPYYSGPVSDHFDGVRFFNPGKPRKGGLRQFLKWQLTAKWEEWPKSVARGLPDRPPPRVEGDTLRVCFVGHATVLVQTQNLNIITDPVWAKRASPSQRIGPLRAQPPGIDFDTLPPVDVILLSHNHYDHMDLATLQRIQKRDGARIITPLGNDTIITAFDRSMSAEAHDWDERIALSDEVHVYLDRTHHWSARGVRDRQMALWASFAVGTPGGTIYFFCRRFRVWRGRLLSQCFREVRPVQARDPADRRLRTTVVHGLLAHEPARSGSGSPGPGPSADTCDSFRHVPPDQ